MSGLRGRYKVPSGWSGVDKEMAERMTVIQILAGHIAQDECENCDGGLYYEGPEWALCECVLRALYEPRSVRHRVRRWLAKPATAEEVGYYTIGLLTGGVLRHNFRRLSR